jgi:hypothetical protein
MPTVRRFRKKPIEISAYQTEQAMVIQTLEGPLQASPGDWIITGINGEQYPCKPDIFERLYEPFVEQAIAR